MKINMMVMTMLAAASIVAAPKPEERGKCPVFQNKGGRENVEWSISYAYHLTDKDKALPRVLLIGDSICNQYAGKASSCLKGKVNVTYWVSSYCVTLPTYMKMLDIYLDADKYDVIHFNNGLHSLSTPTDAWAAGMKAAIELIRKKQPQAKIVWVTSTPLKDAKRTEKVKELNAAGAKVMAEMGGIATNDLFALDDPLNRDEFWSDTFHHKAPLRDKEGEAVANKVLETLNLK